MGESLNDAFHISGKASDQFRRDGLLIVLCVVADGSGDGGRIAEQVTESGDHRALLRADVH